MKLMREARPGTYACKWHHNAKGTILEDINRIDAKANTYWEARAEQTQKEQAETTEQL